MFQIEWSNTASRQRLIVLEFWIEFNKSEAYSRKILKETLRFEQLLSSNPFLGKLTDLEEVKRVLILQNFSLFYKTINNTIYIIGFRDNRRDPENLVFKKFSLKKMIVQPGLSGNPFLDARKSRRKRLGAEDGNVCQIK